MVSFDIDVLPKFSSNCDISKLCLMVLLHHPDISNSSRENLQVFINSYHQISKHMVELFYLTLARLVEAVAPTNNFIASRLDKLVASSDKKMINIDIDNDIPYNADEDSAPHQEISTIIRESLTISTASEKSSNETDLLIKQIINFTKVWLGISSSGGSREQKQKGLPHVDKNSLSPKEFARINKIEYLFGKISFIKTLCNRL